jgi:signal peptidase I
MNTTTQKMDAVPVKEEAKKDDFKGMAKSFVLAILVAMLFRTFLFEPFHIPSGSMKPGLLVGDYIFVAKYSYGISRYSFPFGPALFEGRIGETYKPERGDVVVFKLPKDTGTNYIKRLVGLPGDTIQVKNGILYINGTAVPRQEAKPFVDQDNTVIPQYVETMPNNVSYPVLDQLPYGRLDNTDTYTVPPKHYFFMGDNRDNSEDSRVLSAVGFVPEENLVGPAKVIVFPSSGKWWDFTSWITTIKHTPTAEWLANNKPE